MLLAIELVGLSGMRCCDHVFSLGRSVSRGSLTGGSVVCTEGERTRTSS